MRKLPEMTPPEDITPRDLAIIEQRRTYSLITPLYGGGVTKNTSDPITVVRPTEIRGQLRFWWRACRGWRFPEDAGALRKEEEAIWGKAYEKGDQGISREDTSQIYVDAASVQQGQLIKPFYMDGRTPKPDNGIPGYAAFPLQPDQDERKKPTPFIPDVREGVRFTLTITYPRAKSKEVEAALWAWETFGGLGARTRRGFGAVQFIAMNDVSYRDLPPSQGVEQWIHRQANRYIESEHAPNGVPHLGSDLQLVVTRPFENPKKAWNYLIDKLREFRQYKDNRRSAWPEADTIRTMVGLPAKTTPPQTFPRAAFGLPIIFHFTGDDAPADQTLNEEDMQAKADEEDAERSSKERFASPLILRPFLCQDKRAVGLALLLEGSRVDLDHLTLEEKGNVPQNVRGTLTPKEARDLTHKIPDLKNEIDVLQAFMRSLKGE